MRFFNHCFLVTALCLTISCTPLATATTTTSTAPTTAASPIGGVWTTIPSPRSGNCGGYDVDTMVNDAKTLAQNAITAIQKMINGGLKNTDKTLVETAFTSWGVNYRQISFLNKIWITSGQDTLQTALTNYQTVLSILDGSTSTRARLMCTDAGWTYATKLGDVGQTPADDPLPGIRFSWNPYFSVLIPDIEYDSSGQYGSSICTPYNANGQQLARPDGITWWQANLIMMCAGAFNGKTLSDRISGQSTLAVGTTLDSQQIPGGVFLHEMMHFIGQNIIDVVITMDNGSKVKAYGFDGSLMMAVNPDYAGKAVSNADNYRNFAMAVTLSDVDWSETGDKQS
ncbi:hypothetical protein ZTR_04325 [Talaromyces verruculosus]|nr:hypothetical protein ZTR_04325 [Talaromyces verruculosus]